MSGGPPLKPSIRRATESDGSRLEEIERRCFEDCPWDAASILHDECLVAEIDGIIVGFLVTRELIPGNTNFKGEREILNLAVDPPWRRRGIGRALLNHELTSAAIRFLEVRKTNIAARSLYARMGFEEIGERVDYYQKPLESAIVMKRK
jgi:[ribosomal protein S18]-alanine N-acetyltransferase